MNSAHEFDREHWETLIGHSVQECEPRMGLATNSITVVTLESGVRAVVKIARKREVEVELWALRAMARRRVPVPEVLAGSVDSAVPYLMTRLVQGRDGITTEGTAKRLGYLLRTVHGVPVAGSGFFKDSTHSPPAAELGTWADRVAELVSRLAPIVADGIVSPALFSNCRDRLLDTALWQQPCVFVHGDLHPRHVLCTDAHVEALIDWADCGAAPLWMDLARMDLDDPGLQHALFDGYFPDGLPADGALHLANYRLLHRILALLWEYEGGGDWLHERIPGIEEALFAT